MTSLLSIISIGGSALLLLMVLELVRRKKLTEEYSLVWILCALALLAAALGRRWVDQAALAIGIAYPPAALLLVLGFFVFVASVGFSVIISTHRQQLDRAIEDIAVLEAELRELRRAHTPTRPA